jgi:hypothetical protein
MFWILHVQQVSLVQLLQVILSLLVQHVSPIQLLLIKVPVHKKVLINKTQDTKLPKVGE